MRVPVSSSNCALPTEFIFSVHFRSSRFLKCGPRPTGDPEEGGSGWGAPKPNQNNLENEISFILGMIEILWEEIVSEPIKKST